VGTVAENTTFEYTIRAEDTDGTDTYLDREQVDITNSPPPVPTLTWGSASDWNSATEESGVRHETFGGAALADVVQIGYNSSGVFNDGSLLVYYPFEETSGTTANDGSGNLRDATRQTGVTQGTTGVFGSTSYSFSGNGAEVEDIDANLYLDGLSEFTVSWWSQSDQTGSDSGVFTTSDPDGTDSILLFRYDSSGFIGSCSNCIKYSISDNSGNQQAIETQSGAQTTGWEHYMMTWESTSGELDLYKNGVLLSDSASDPTSSVVTGTLSAEKLLIGKASKGGSSSGWDGRVDEFQIYARSSTLADAQLLYSATNNGTLTTAQKSFSTAQQPNLENLTYSLNGGSITLTVIGSPGTVNEETNVVSLTGQTTETLSWTQSHTDFSVRLDMSSPAQDDSPTFDEVSLVGS
jgi:hypothetical protein